MPKNADWEMLQNALQNLGEGQLRRTTLNNQHQTQMQQLALEEQLREIQQGRTDAAQAHWNEMEKIGSGKNEIGQQRADNETTKVNSQADLNAAKAKALPKPFFIYDQKDPSGNAVGVSGTFDDADSKLQQLQSQKPDSSFIVSTAAPKSKVERKMPDGSTLYLDPDHAAQFDAKMAEVNRPRLGPTDSVSEKISATSGSEGTPAVPASTGFFGIGAHPEVPAVPAVPPSNEKTVIHRVPRGKFALPPPPPASPAAVQGAMSALPDSGTPVSPNATQQNNADILKQAQDAINAGADPAAVKARLLKLGIQQ